MNELAMTYLSKSCMVEPGAYAANFGKSAQIADVLEPYADFRKQFMARLTSLERGDPKATAEAVLKLVDAQNPPLRLVLGSTILPGGARLIRGSHRYVGGRLERSAGPAHENFNCIVIAQQSADEAANWHTKEPRL